MRFNKWDLLDVVIVSLMIMLMVIFSGCGGAFGIRTVELGTNEQLVIRRQNIGAGMSEINDTRMRYREEQGQGS